MILAAFISFVSFALLVTHMPPQWVRRIVGYKGCFDVLLHSTIIWMFLGTSTEGLLQAEAAGILISMSLRFYHWALGYERLVKFKWVRYAGKFSDAQPSTAKRKIP